MIDSILPALGLRPKASHCLCRTASAGSIDSFAPAHSAVRPARLSRSIPMGSIDSTASRILALRAARPHHRVPAFETRSRPPLSRRYPRGFAFYVAFPKSSIRLSLPICVAQFPSVHSGIRPSHCAALGAGAELVVLVFEQDATNLRLPICDCRFCTDLNTAAPVRGDQNS